MKALDIIKQNQKADNRRDRICDLQIVPCEASCRSTHNSISHNSIYSNIRKAIVAPTAAEYSEVMMISDADDVVNAKPRAEGKGVGF